MTPILLGLTTVLAMLYLYHARQNKILKTDALLPRGQWSTHRVTFLNFGLVFALGFVTMAFEMETAVPNYDREIIMELNSEAEVEVIRTAYPEEKELPPPPPIEKVKLKFDPLAELELAENTEDVPELDLIEDTPVPVPENAKMVIAPPSPPEPVAPPSPTIEEDDIFRVVEQMPMFPGCSSKKLSEAERQSCATTKMLAFVYQHVKYPALARENGIQGTAVVKFVVEKDGSITNITIVKDPGGLTGESVFSVVERFPDWIPGKQRGKPVRVEFNLPVKFTFAD